MEIKILNSIKFNELMPWSINEVIIKSFSERLKKANFKDPANDVELFEQVSFLVADYPDLLKWLSKQKPQSETLLHSNLFQSELPDFTDTSSKFYSILISKEKQRLYNYFITHSSKFTHKVDIIFTTNQALRNIKALVKSIVKDIEDRGFEDMPTNASSLTHFVLHYLKLELIGLYFDIQELNKIHLPSIITLEDFYLTELNLPKYRIVEFSEIEVDNQTTKKTSTQKKNNFGFTGDKVKLKTVISLLCRDLELLNEEESPQDLFFKLLTSKDIKTTSPQIHLHCETAIFCYILDRFKVTFTNFIPRSIEKSALFYSKNGTLLNSQNLYASKLKSPKSKADIDNIFKQMT